MRAFAPQHFLSRCNSRAIHQRMQMPKLSQRQGHCGFAISFAGYIGHGKPRGLSKLAR